MEIVAKVLTAILISGLGFLIVYEIVKLVKDVKKKRAKQVENKDVDKDKEN